MVMRKTGSAGDGDGKVTEVEREPRTEHRKTSSVQGQEFYRPPQPDEPMSDRERREIVDGEG